jgi:hypothetical protein
MLLAIVESTRSEAVQDSQKIRPLGICISAFLMIFHGTSGIDLLKPPTRKASPEKLQMLIPYLNIQFPYLLNQRLTLLNPKTPLKPQQGHHPLRHRRIRRITQKAPRPAIQLLRPLRPARGVYQRGLCAPHAERAVDVFEHGVEIHFQIAEASEVICTQP